MENSKTQKYRGIFKKYKAVFFKKIFSRTTKRAIKIMLNNAAFDIHRSS